MSYGDNEGPVERAIPAITVITCQGCRYHSHQMLKSGNHPIYENRCSKVKAYPGDFSPDRLIPDWISHGLLETPSWCPFLTPKQQITQLS